MTISSTTTSVSYTGNGSTTAFPVTFAFFGTGTSAEIEVIERVIATGAETTKTYSTHYTVTGGNGSTGTVTAGSAPADTVQWHIRRKTTQTQGTDYVENDAFPAESHEEALDRLTMISQEQEADITKSIRYSDTYTGGASATFPDPVAGAFIAFNSAGDGITTSTDVASQWLGGDGTVSAPYYSFSGDVNSGFYRIGSDNVGLTLGGTKRVDFGTATTAFSGEVTATGFTGTLDGILGSGTPAAATVASLTSGGNVVSDTDSTDDLGTNSVRWANLYVDAVTTTDNTTIGGNLTVTGNLTINGTTVTNDATNTEVKDPLIELNSGAGSNANDLGIIMERGSTGDNTFMGWDESADKFAFGTTTATGSSTGNISYTDAQLLAEGATFSGTSPDLGTVTTIDINGGTVDGATIGASAQTTGQFTNLTGTVVTASTSLALATGATVTGILDEDNMSTNSATQLATQQSIKAYVDTSQKAPGISMTWETDTSDSDAGNGKVWANHATLSSATVLYFDDVENNGVSINDLIDSLDDPTATNSAMIYIQEAGTGNAGAVFAVSGNVSDASGYSKVAVTHKATFGTLADGDTIGVIFAFSGDNGSLTDPMSTRGDIIVRDASNATARLGVGSANTVLSTDGTDVSYSQVSGAMIANDAIDSQHYADGSIDTAHIANNAVDETKLKDALIADFTEVTVTASDSIIFGDATDSGNTKRDTVQGILDLASGGGFTQTAEVATTSGTTASITGIPSGVKLVILMLNNVSNGTGDMKIRIGDSGGIETSSYDTKGLDIQSSAGTHTDATDGWLIEEQVGGGCSFTGQIFFTLQDAANNHWVATGNFQNGLSYGFTGGDKALSAELTQLQIVSGTTLDAGTINALYI